MVPRVGPSPSIGGCQETLVRCPVLLLSVGYIRRIRLSMLAHVALGVSLVRVPRVFSRLPPPAAGVGGGGGGGRGTAVPCHFSF